MYPVISSEGWVGKKGMPRGHGDVSIWGIPFYDRIQRAGSFNEMKSYEKGGGDPV
jgi:hypothetical protein